MLLFVLCRLGSQQLLTSAFPPAVVVWFSLFDPAAGEARQPLCHTANQLKTGLAPSTVVQHFELSHRQQSTDMNYQDPTRQEEDDQHTAGK